MHATNIALDPLPRRNVRELNPQENVWQFAARQLALEPKSLKSYDDVVEHLLPRLGTDARSTQPWRITVHRLSQLGAMRSADQGRNSLALC